MIEYIQVSRCHRTNTGCIRKSLRKKVQKNGYLTGTHLTLSQRPARAVQRLVGSGFLNNFISSLQLPAGLDETVIKTTHNLLLRSVELEEGMQKISGRMDS